MFDAATDYDLIVQRKFEAETNWRLLSRDEQAKYANITEYESAIGIQDPKDKALIPAKNLSILKKEIKGRVDRLDPVKSLSIEPLDFDDAIIELAESIENLTEIRELYRLRKTSVGNSKNAGIAESEAAKIRNCFTQGRELYLAGRNGSLMVKPLNFFYGLTAYTYGIIVLNNPLRYRKDMLPGSHGMSYIPTTIQAQFGGDTARGTFSDLVGAFPTHLINSSGFVFNIDCSKSIMAFYENKFDVSLGTLISLIPEMADYYALTTGLKSRCYPLKIVSISDARSVTWEFQIGNGETRPTRLSLETAFPGFALSERHGQSIVSVPPAQVSSISATIYNDLRGDLWYVDNPFYPVVLPEIAVHFLINSMFSNIMRYRPDEWGNVLSNDVSSNISLLTRHYFSTFQRKFMLLVLRSASRYFPYAMRG